MKFIKSSTHSWGSAPSLWGDLILPSCFSSRKSCPTAVWCVLITRTLIVIVVVGLLFFLTSISSRARLTRAETEKVKSRCWRSQKWESSRAGRSGRRGSAPSWRTRPSPCWSDGGRLDASSRGTDTWSTRRVRRARSNDTARRDERAICAVRRRRRRRGWEGGGWMGVGGRKTKENGQIGKWRAHYAPPHWVLWRTLSHPPGGSLRWRSWNTSHAIPSINKYLRVQLVKCVHLVVCFFNTPGKDKHLLSLSPAWLLDNKTPAKVAASYVENIAKGQSVSLCLCALFVTETNSKIPFCAEIIEAVAAASKLISQQQSLQ